MVPTVPIEHSTGSLPVGPPGPPSASASEHVPGRLRLAGWFTAFSLVTFHARQLSGGQLSGGQRGPRTALPGSLGLKGPEPSSRAPSVLGVGRRFSGLSARCVRGQPGRWGARGAPGGSAQQPLSSLTTGACGRDLAGPTPQAAAQRPGWSRTQAVCVMGGWGPRTCLWAWQPQALGGTSRRPEHKSEYESKRVPVFSQGSFYVLSSGGRGR